MSADKPRFELQRVYEDGSGDEPQIVPLTCLPWEVKAGRRGFLGAGVTAASVLMAIGAASSPEAVHAKQGGAISSRPSGEGQVGVPGQKLMAHRGRIGGLYFSADGQVLVSGGADQLVKVWPVPDFTFGASFGSQASEVRALAGTPDAQRIILSSNDGTARILSRVDGQLVMSFQGLNANGSPVAVSPSGDILACSSAQDQIMLWSLFEGRQIQTLPESAGAAALAVTPDSQMLLSGSRDNKIRVWSLPDGALLGTLPGHLGWVTGLAVTPDGRMLASTGSSDKAIKFWELPSGRLLGSLPIEAEARKIAMTPDGSVLAAGCVDGVVRLWSPPGGRWVGTLTGHSSQGLEVAVSTDGRWLAAGDVNGVVVVWDLQSLAFRGFLFDPAANTGSGLSFTGTDTVTGQVITYTLPCGSPIPPGAVCVCNCVPGTYQPPPPPPPSRPGGTVCTCDQVCVCVPVFR